MLQGQQGASLQLTARLQQELATFKPTLAINNGDIAYARHAAAGSRTQSPRCLTMAAQKVAVHVCSVPHCWTACLAACYEPSTAVGAPTALVSQAGN